MILDLDVIVPPEKQVKLGGNTYSLLTGIPTMQILALQRAVQDNPTSADTISAIREILLFSFKKYPEAEEIINSLTIDQTTAIINYLFGVDVEKKT